MASASPAVRKAAPNCESIADANEGWTPSGLERNLAACAEAGVTLVEQPLPAGWDGYEAWAHPPAGEGLRGRERARPQIARGPARALRRRQHQARQDWRWPDRGAGDGRCGQSARFRHHGGLDGRELAGDGAGDAAPRQPMARVVDLDFRTAAAGARSRRWPAPTAVWFVRRSPRSGADARRDASVPTTSQLRRCSASAATT